MYPDLVAECGAVVLRVVPWADLDIMAGYVAGGLFPDSRVMLGGWYDDSDRVASARRTVAYHLSSFANMNANRLCVPLGIYVDGVPVGVQSVSGDAFAVARVGSTGSWVAPQFRGNGFGKAAREAILAVTFDVLGAEWAVTSAIESNVSSLAVTAAAGYSPDGRMVEVPGGEAVMLLRFRMSRDDWAQRARPPVRLSGFDDLVADLGLS